MKSIFIVVLTLFLRNSFSQNKMHFTDEKIDQTRFNSVKKSIPNQVASIVSGTVIYNNSENTVLRDITLNLMNGTTLVATATTNANGTFIFPNVANGSYTIKATTNIPWGDVTAIDALVIRRHIANIDTIAEPIRLTAADVNASGFITATDILKVQRRISGLDVTFTRPDWIFEKKIFGGNEINVDGTDLNLNIYAICTGDINGSYVPLIQIPNCGIVTDIDGNVYNTVEIGTQCWMKENLKTLHYSNGTTINGVYAYNNNENYVATYGRLYTWAAVMNTSTSSALNPSGVQGVCPTGWHVPSDAEWCQLSKFLDAGAICGLYFDYESNIAGGKLKEAGTTHWINPNTGNNSSGFTALPGGERISNGMFDVIGRWGSWWSTTKSNAGSAWYRLLIYYSNGVVRNDLNIGYAISVRCVRDI